MKPYNIFTRINRTNARYLFESLLDWMQYAGFAGLVILLDVSRLTVSRNPRTAISSTRRLGDWTPTSFLGNSWMRPTGFVASCSSLSPTQTSLMKAPQEEASASTRHCISVCLMRSATVNSSNPMGALIRIAPSWE